MYVCLDVCICRFETRFRLNLATFIYTTYCKKLFNSTVRIRFLCLATMFNNKYWQQYLNFPPNIHKKKMRSKYFLKCNGKLKNI